MKEKLLERIKYFGIEQQKRKFGEEADELKEAITEYETLKKYVGGAKMGQLKNHIAEEIADNLAMLKQFQLFYEISNEEIKEWLDFKNIRTDKKIKNGEYKQGEDFFE